MKGKLELRSVSKSFRNPDGSFYRVLSNVSMELKGGGRARIDGPSGAGKSTLLNCLSGLLMPDEGEVRIDGEPLSRWPESKRDRFRSARIGYIFQSFNLIAPLTILENLTLPPLLCGRADSGLEARARETLARFGLADQAAKRPYQLSVGQRQRVAVARALLQRPVLLLADEPTASLDAASGREVIDALRELNAQGTTLVAATHDPAFREMEFDTVIQLAGKEAAS